MNTNDKAEIIMKEFASMSGLYQDFTTKIETLLKDILKSNKVNIHSISSRCKNENSLREKVKKSTDRYNDLLDITDLSGIRIITYFQDDVDKIANIIEEEFEIDSDNSVDKRKALDPDRFGYLSLHYVVRLNNKRENLIEYSRFEKCFAEIQIRTILQHTWAEIEHDLGYKSNLEVPKEVVRSFSRLSGLLELADNEFLRIRDTVNEYTLSVKQSIEEEAYDLSIDKHSLTSFIETNKAIIDLENYFATFGKLKSDISLRENEIDRLNEFGINKISDLSEMIEKNSEKIKSLAKEWLKRPTNLDHNRRVRKFEFSRGISLFYLCYVLLLQKNDSEFAEWYFEKYSIGFDRKKSVQELFEIYSKLADEKQ